MSDIAELKHLVKSLQQASSDKVRVFVPVAPAALSIIPPLMLMLIIIPFEHFRRSSTSYRS
jgi:hypothetical protein